MFSNLRWIIAVMAVLIAGGAAQAAKSDGIHKTYYDSGELKFESTYKGGELNGITKEYAKDGTLKAKYLFKEGTVTQKQAINARTPRNLGGLSFVRSWVFWAVVGGVVLAGGFVFSTIAFKNRPF